MESNLFDGKTCSKCKAWTPYTEIRKNKNTKDGYHTQCKACAHLYDLDHRDHHIACASVYRNEKRDELNAKSRARHAANVEALHKRQREIRRQKWESDPAAAREAERIKRAKYSDAASIRRQKQKQLPGHTEKMRLAVKASRLKNPKLYASMKKCRRARERTNGGHFTHHQWEALCGAYGNVCLCCGKNVSLTVDHVIPVKKGGNSNIENIQPLCGPCNSSKKTKTTDYRIAPFRD